MSLDSSSQTDDSESDKRPSWWVERGYGNTEEDVILSSRMRPTTNVVITDCCSNLLTFKYILQIVKNANNRRIVCPFCRGFIEKDSRDPTDPLPVMKYRDYVKLHKKKSN